MADELTSQRRIEIEARMDQMFASESPGLVRLSDMMADLVAEIERLEEENSSLEDELYDQLFLG